MSGRNAPQEDVSVVDRGSYPSPGFDANYSGVLYETNVDYFLELRPGGGVRCGARPDGNLNYFEYFGSLPVGSWTHLACTFDDLSENQSVIGMCEMGLITRLQTDSGMVFEGGSGFGVISPNIHNLHRSA